MKKRLMEQNEKLKTANLEAEREIQEGNLKKQRGKSQMKAYLDKQIGEISRNKIKKKLEEELEKQVYKNKKLCFEWTEMKEKEDERRRMRELKTVIENYLTSENQIKNEQKKAENEEEERRNIYKYVREYLEKRKERQGMIRDSERKKVSVRIFKKLEKSCAEQREKENKKIEAERMEKDALSREELLKLKQKREKLSEELVKDRKKWEEESEKHIKQNKVKRAEEIVHRENLQKFLLLWNEAEKKKEKDKKNEVRNAYLEQWKEDKKRREDEKKREIAFRDNLEKENEELVKYCDYVLDQTKKHKRPLFPVLSAIKGVKTQCGVIKPEKILNHLKSTWGHKPSRVCGKTKIYI